MTVVHGEVLAINRDVCGLTGAVGGEVFREGFFGLVEFDAILRSLGTCNRRDDRGKVQLEIFREHRLDVGVVPQPLRLRIRLDESYRFGGSTSQFQVINSDLIDGEHRGGRAELRAHVSDRGAVRQRDLPDALAVKLDEFSDHAVHAQHFRDGEDHVGRRDS